MMSYAKKDVRRRAFSSFAVIATIAVLSACSSTASGGSSSEPASASGSISGNVIKLSGADTSNLGGNLTIPVGLNLALTGQASADGLRMANGAKLAAAQIKAAGGPNFQLVLKDNQSGVAQAGVQTTRELGQAGVKFALYSFIGDLGSAFAGMKQYQILSLDGGGGIAPWAFGTPYFYGTRAQTPTDTYLGVEQYLHEAMPKVKTAALVIGDTGSANNAASEKAATTALNKAGIKLLQTDVVTYGGTDFSSAVAKVGALKPDIILDAQWGDDIGYFLKQLRGAGSTTPVLGTDFVPDTPQIAGSAADGFMFSEDYFDASAPQNSWAKYFAATYQKKYGTAPDFDAANYYEDLFTIWQTVQRVLKSKGSVTNSADIMKAFESNLTFPSVYGAPKGGVSYGTYSIDSKTHALSSRDMGVYEYDNDAVKQLASFQIGGKGFHLTK